MCLKYIMIVPGSEQHYNQKRGNMTSTAPTLEIYHPYSNLHDRRKGKLSTELTLALGSELIDNHNCPTAFAALYLAIHYFRSGRTNFGPTFSCFSWVRDAKGSAVQTEVMNNFQREATRLNRLKHRHGRHHSTATEDVLEVLALENLGLIRLPLNAPESAAPFVNGWAITNTMTAEGFVVTRQFQAENEGRLGVAQIEYIQHLENIPPSGYYSGQKDFWEEVESLL